MIESKEIPRAKDPARSGAAVQRTRRAQRRVAREVQWLFPPSLMLVLGVLLLAYGSHG